MARRERVSILIEAENRASRTFTDIARDLKLAEKDFKSGRIGIRDYNTALEVGRGQAQALVRSGLKPMGAEQRALQRIVRDTGGELKGQSSLLQSLRRNWLKVAAAVGIAVVAVRRAVRGFLDLAKRGGDVLEVQRAFNNMFPRSAEALDHMREATFGLIANYDLMKKANQAVILGAAKTSDQFADLAQKAILLGRAQGVDALGSLNSLLNGIARQSRRMLDNIGIVVDATEAYRKYAEANHLVASELNATQRRQAFLNEALRQANVALEGAGKAAFNNADNIQRIKTAFINAKDGAAQWVAESDVIAAALDKVAEAANRVKNALRGARGAFSPEFQAETQAQFLLANLPRGEAGRRQLIELVGEAQGRAEELRPELERARTQADVLRGAPQREAQERVRLLQREIRLQERLSEILAERFRLFFGARPTAPGVGAPPIGPTLPGGADVGLPLGLGPIDLTPPGAVPGATRGGAVRGIELPEPEDLTGTEMLIAGPEVPPGFEGEDALKKGAKKAGDEADKAAPALIAVAGALQAAGMAALQSGRGIEQALIPAITNIISSLPGVGGVTGAFLTAAGGIFSAFIGANNDRDRPRVVVDDYGGAAERKMRDAQRQPDVQVYFNGRELSQEMARQLGYSIRRLSRLRGESVTGVD